MKQRYDEKTVVREFKPGEQVLVLLPILGFALQARYTGPYRVERRVGDVNYVIATPTDVKDLACAMLTCLSVTVSEMPWLKLKLQLALKVLTCLTV